MADSNQPAIKLYKAPPTTSRWHRHPRQEPITGASRTEPAREPQPGPHKG